MSATRGRLRSVEEWRSLGRLDPLYSVATWPGREGSWTEAGFYEVGRSDWEDFREQWLRYWPELGRSCVELGCGAGRITHAMVNDFDRVVALDVSPEMIERARRVTPTGAEFHLVDGEQLPLSTDSVEAGFSCHVLQHLDDWAAVRSYLAELRRTVRPTGTIMVHMALDDARSSPLRRGARAVRLWRSHRRLAGGRYPRAMRLNTYPASQVKAALEELGYEDVELGEFPVRSNGSAHSFWFARVPSC